MTVRRSESSSDSAQPFKNGVVQYAVCGHDAAIGRQRPAAGEIQRLPVEVRHASAGLLDNDRPRGLIPKFFAVIEMSWRHEPQQDLGAAGGEYGVFGLA